MGHGGDEILHVDAAKHSVGIGTTTPPASGSNGHLFVVAGDISASGDLHLESTKKLYLNKTEDTYLDSDSTDRIRFVAGGQQMLVLDYDTGNRAAFGDTKVSIGGGDNYLPTKELEVVGDISASGDLFKTKFVQMTNSSSVIDTFNTGSFRSAKYTLQVTSASNFQVSELLVLHHNSTASNTEYAQINSGLNLIDFTTDISNSNVRLNAAGSFISCSVRLDRTIIPT